MAASTSQIKVVVAWGNGEVKNMTNKTSRSATPAPVFPLARNSTVDLIAMELRTAIYSGALPVGSPLREVEISSQLGVSRGPFREASQRLVQEGLLTAIPGRGLRVTTIEPELVHDVYEARLAVEAQAVRSIVRAQNSAAVAKILQSYDELVNVSMGEDAWVIGDADLAFHQVLVDAAESQRLSRMMATLVIETRMASLSVAEGYSVRRSISPTYERLLAALQAGDAEAAIHALTTQFAAAVARINGRDDSVDTVETQTAHEPQEFQPLAHPTVNV